ncbi:MAG: hypothetical protein ACI85F_001721 [Bacteroidia bacterium]|jgi:hypothetical protein
MKWLTKHWQIILITIVGAGLRFYSFSDWSLSNDELSYLTRFHLPNFWEVFQYGMSVDVHPPAVQTLLYFWTGWFGDSPASIRLPFVVLGTLSIPLIYLVGRDWFNESSGLLSALFLATLEYPLLFSRVARPYGFGMFVLLLTAFFIGRILKGDKPKIGDQVGMAIGLALCAYTHYFCALSAIILAGIGLFYTSTKNRKGYMFGGIGAFVLFMPYLGFLRQHLALGGLDDWLPTPTMSWIFEYLFQALNNSWLILICSILIIVTGIISNWTQERIRASKVGLCLAVFFGTFLVGYVYSTQVEPVMQYSGLLFAFPFLLLGTFGFVNLPKDTMKFILPIALSIIIFDTIASQKFYETEHYGVFKELAQKAALVKSEDSSALLIADVNHELYLNYYLERLGQPDLRFDNYSLTEGDDLKKLHGLCENSTSENCLVVWSTKGQKPEFSAIVEHYFPDVIEVGDYFNSGFVHCQKGTDLSDSWLSNIDWTNKNNWNTNTKGIELVNDTAFQFKFTDSNEFGPTFEIDLNEDFSEFNSVTVTTRATIDDNLSQFQLVCSQHLKDGTDHWESRPFNLQLQSGETGTAVFRFELKEEFKNGGRLKIYPWLPPGGSMASISQIELKLNVRAAFQ